MPVTTRSVLLSATCMARWTFGVFSRRTGTTCWWTQCAAKASAAMRASRTMSTKSSSRVSRTPATLPRTSSQPGAGAPGLLASTIELPLCRELALDLLAALLALLGALAGLALAKQDARDLAGAGEHAYRADGRVYAEGGGGLGALAHGAGGGAQGVEHGHQLVLDLHDGASEVQDGVDQRGEEADADEGGDDEHDVEHGRPPAQDAEEDDQAEDDEAADGCSRDDEGHLASHGPWSFQEAGGSGRIKFSTFGGRPVLRGRRDAAGSGGTSCARSPRTTRLVMPASRWPGVHDLCQMRACRVPRVTYCGSHYARAGERGPRLRREAGWGRDGLLMAAAALLCMF